MDWPIRTIGAIALLLTTQVAIALLAWADIALAQVITTLEERSDYVGACRKTAEALPLYEDARLTKPIGSLPPTTKVTLTGVLGDGVAQIKDPGLGWVQAVKLLSDCGSPPSQGLLPVDIDTNPLYCRRLRSSKVDGPNFRYLDAGLVAFDQPGGSLQQYQGQPDGPASGAVVRITKNPAETQTTGDRDWIRVKYASRSGTKRLGWIALGSPNGLRSIATCLPNQE